MKIFISSVCLILIFIDLNAQCSTCTFHEFDPVTSNFCDLPEVPNDSCLLTIDTCFSGWISDAFFNTPIVDDSIDSQYFIVPSNMIIQEIEWCIVDQVLPTTGTIQIGSYTTNFSGMGSQDTICVNATLATPLYPGVHTFSVNGDLQFLNYVDWKINLTLSSCSSMVILSNPESGTVDTESLDWISSSQIINAGAVIDYDAVDSIILLPNFHAKLGSTVNAFIDGCGGMNFNHEKIPAIAK